MRLAKNPPAPWTLIGAHMVAVHGWAIGRQPVRTSLDADVLVDVRLVTDGTAVVSEALVRDGFELVDYSATGLATLSRLEMYGLTYSHLTTLVSGRA